MTEQIQVPDPEKAITYLRDAQTIRDHCLQIRKRFESGESSYFYYHPEKWAEICEKVSEITLKNYPDLKIPVHSRWRHFNVGGQDRLGELAESIKTIPALEKAKIQCELVILSVLLDAGAGDAWRFYENSTNGFYSRSEGLALASLYMYKKGSFSADPTQKLRVDSTGLISLNRDTLAHGFQVTESNPLLGLEGRCTLLNSLGLLIEKDHEVFPEKRLGDFFIHLSKQVKKNPKALLSTVLETFQEIWPSRLMMGNKKLGDVSRHTHIHAPHGTDGLIPFHKLSQWLSYSLIEPLQEFGIEIDTGDGLTGLAEYRNGGLFLDGGLLSLKDDSDLEKTHKPDSEIITEWRALTVSLLDELLLLVRKQLKKEDLSLGQMLQGGTWAAGRELAYKMRKEGGPPLQIVSDGTLF